MGPRWSNLSGSFSWPFAARAAPAAPSSGDYHQECSTCGARRPWAALHVDGRKTIDCGECHGKEGIHAGHWASMHYPQSDHAAYYRAQTSIGAHLQRRVEEGE